MLQQMRESGDFYPENHDAISDMGIIARGVYFPAFVC
jgi:hypothetical protein